MSANKAEVALARLVASLTRQSEEDIEDILKRLDPAERKALRPLLAGHGLAAPIEEPPPNKEEPKPEFVPPPGVSPWLARRLAAVSARSADGSSIRMTSLAQETLRLVAAERIEEPEEPRAPRRWRLFTKKADANRADEHS